MAIATLMATCGVFLMIGWTAGAYGALALMIGGTVCIAAANAGNTSQDLKTGFLVGATPSAQQKGLFLGVLTSSIVIGITLLMVDKGLEKWDNATKCLNTKAVVPASGDPGVRKDLVRYRSYMKKTSSRSAEMVLQADKQGSGSMPEGGYYTLLADIEAVTAQKTAVTISGPSMLYGDVFDAVAEWAKGKARICPSLP